MSIPLFGAAGDLFNRWGKQIGGINEFSSAQSTANSRVATIFAQFQATDQAVVANLSNAQSQTLSTSSALQTEEFNEIPATLIQMAIDDGIGINPQTLPVAITKLATQMTASSNSINKPTLGQTITAGGSNTGNGVVVCSFIDGVTGTQSDYLIPETIVATCTADAYPGDTAVAGQEPFQFIGQLSVAPTAWNWPQGSGTSLSINTVNAAAAGGLVTDGGFEAWSGSPAFLTDWSKVTGTWGTTLVQESGAGAYTGSFALGFVGSGGGEHTEIQQLLGTLQPNTVYAFTCWAKQDGSVVAGVLQFRLLNANGDAQIVDAAGNNALISLTCSTLTTSYAPVSGFFRTPTILPSAGVLLDIYASTAITNAHTVYLDQLQIAKVPSPLYPGGPYVAAFAGNVNFKVGDTFNLALTNSLTTTSFAVSLNRTLGLAALGPAYKIPSSVSPTIADNLIG